MKSDSAKTGMLRRIASTLLGVCALLLPTAVSAADYTIQPEDVLSIQVTGEAGLSRNYQVDEQGFILMDLIGKVKLAGVSAEDAQKKLTAELGKFLKLFEVKVFVVGAQGTRVLVVGEVAKIGSIKLREGGKLLDVLAEAGQVLPSADRKRISIARRDGGKTETVDLDAILSNPKLDVLLAPGDTITVPPKTSRAVRVEGEVKNSGLKPLEEAKTAYTALNAAGVSDKADWTRVVIVRKNSEKPLIVDLTPVRKGDISKDVPLQEGDEIRILSKFTGTARVDGQVKTTGEKELNGDVYLLDFLNTAGGGFTELADQLRVRVNRGGKELEFDLVAVQRGLRRNDDPELKVLPGDVIFVPKAISSLTGQVKNPKIDLPIGANTNIYDFILSAGGGFTDEADKARVRVTRGKEEFVVDLTNVANGMVSKNDPKLKLLPGDEIFVPNDDTLRFVIVGGISKPGRYPVTPHMTLLDAIAAAGNFTERATRKNFVVARADRFNSDGSIKLDPKTLQGKKDQDLSVQGLEVIDYKKLLKGDPKQNVAIHPGDRILIPEEQPQVKGPKPSFVDRLLRLVPLATLFMGVGYGGGYGIPGYGF